MYAPITRSLSYLVNNGERMLIEVRSQVELVISPITLHYCYLFFIPMKSIIITSHCALQW